jgi:acyl dehydratase
MLTARQLYFEAVKVGDELPPLVKPPVDRLQIARYAGAAQDWNPLSVDEQYARNAGFPSALVPAMISMGFLGELVLDWVRGARLRKFQARFVKIVWPGDVLTVRGRVVDRRFEAPGRYAADIETWAENQRGELVVRGVATFQLYYNQEDDVRQRATSGRPLAPPKALPAPPPPRPSTPASAAAPLAAAAAPAPRSAAPPPAARPAPAARLAALAQTSAKRAGGKPPKPKAKGAGKLLPKEKASAAKARSRAEPARKALREVAKKRR